MTASIGVAVCPRDAGDYDALPADKRLYQAKAAGRGCVRVARPHDAADGDAPSLVPAR